MLGILKSIFRGGTQPSNDLNLSMGYSPDAAKAAAKELTDQRASIIQLGKDIKTTGSDRDNKLENAILQASSAIGKVAQNLRGDSSDLSRLGLARHALSPIIELMGRLLNQAKAGAPQVDESKQSAINALNQISTEFRRLSDRTMQVDDTVILKGLEETVRTLCGAGN